MTAKFDVKEQITLLMFERIIDKTGGLKLKARPVKMLSDAGRKVLLKEASSHFTHEVFLEKLVVRVLDPLQCLL